LILSISRRSSVQFDEQTSVIVTRIFEKQALQREKSVDEENDEKEDNESSDVEDNDTNDPGIGVKVRRDSLEMGLRKT